MRVSGDSRYEEARARRLEGVRRAVVKVNGVLDAIDERLKRAYRELAEAAGGLDEQPALTRRVGAQQRVLAGAVSALNSYRLKMYLIDEELIDARTRQELGGQPQQQFMQNRSTRR